MARNTFEELCYVANRKNWCWNLWCTTCGHHQFRTALPALADGLDPRNGLWPLLDHDLGRATGWPFFGEEPRRTAWPWPAIHSSAWPLEKQEALACIVAEARAIKLAKRCHFPSWLGYLGLGLAYTEKSERKTRLLTRSWGPQLSEFVEAGSGAETMLSEIARDPERVLEIYELEVIEQCVRAEFRQAPAR